MAARILALDDNATNLELMLYLLRAFGHSADGYTDPVHALRRLREEEYDAALVDIRMPEMDGFEFVQRAESQGVLGSPCFIAVTALAMVGDKDRILNSGFDGYIPKPIDPERFLMEIDAVLRNGRHKANTGPIVLVVDDVQTNIDVIRGTLSPFGYRIVEAHDASGAIRKIHSERPELILSDVHMQNSSGLEILDLVMSDPELRGIPFYFISSSMWQTSERRQALERGARKFLQRPIEPAQLLQEVRMALGESGDG